MASKHEAKKLTRERYLAAWKVVMQHMGWKTLLRVEMTIGCLLNILANRPKTKAEATAEFKRIRRSVRAKSPDPKPTGQQILAEIRVIAAQMTATMKAHKKLKQKRA